MTVKKFLGRLSGTLLAALLSPVKVIFLHALMLSAAVLAIAVTLTFLPIIACCVGGTMLFTHDSKKARSFGIMLLYTAGAALTAPLIAVAAAIIISGMLLTDIFVHTKRAMRAGMYEGLSAASEELFSGRDLGEKYMSNYLGIAKRRFLFIPSLFKRKAPVIATDIRESYFETSIQDRLESANAVKTTEQTFPVDQQEPLAWRRASAMSVTQASSLMLMGRERPSHTNGDITPASGLSYSGS